MKSLLNRITGRSSSTRKPRTRRPQPRIQHLETRRLFAGPDAGIDVLPEDARADSALIGSLVAGNTDRTETTDCVLDQPVSLHYQNADLINVVADLESKYDIEVVLPWTAESDFNPFEKVNFDTRNVTLRSALRMLISDLNLTYSIQDEVLMITGKDDATEIPTKVYPVVDLVVPINAVGQQEPGGGFGGGGGVSFEQESFQQLMDLIDSTVEPGTWEDLGGESTMQAFEGNLSLVVSQTQDVHEQIADLLEQLRRLQDLQVTIEVRFITLNDSFFEQIGVDFDFNLNDNSGLTEAELTDDAGPSITVGLEGTGNPDLDAVLKSSKADTFSFGPSAVNFGFAILSDIEVFFLLQAQQGDRVNVLQAPTVTLFNGQSAWVSDTASTPFVTTIIPVVG